MVIVALKDSIGLLKKNRKSLAMILLPLIFLSLIIQLLNFVDVQRYWPLLTLANILNFSLFLYTPLIYIGITRVFLNDGDSESFFEMMNSSSQFWLATVVMLLISKFIVILGTIAFLIPGLYLATRYSFAPFAIVQHKMGGLYALEWSWKATKPMTWTLMLGIAILFGVLYLAMHSLSMYSSPTANLLGIVIYDCLYIPFYLAFTCSIYTRNKVDMASFKTILNS